MHFFRKNNESNTLHDRNKKEWSKKRQANIVAWNKFSGKKQ